MTSKEKRMNNYKDKCDECGNFDYLKGINGRCLCSNCQNKLNKNQNIKKIQKNNKKSKKNTCILKRKMIY